MKRRLITLVVVVACGLGADAARADGPVIRDGTPVGRLAASIVVLDPTATLTPTAADYTNDYVEITGASGLRVDVSAKKGKGLQLFVRCSDAAPRIALADFLVRTLTPPGPGGTSISVYTAITATDQLLWSTTNAPSGSTTVSTDIRIKNLFAYPDPIGAGTTGYTNNLTFTVVEI